MAAGQETCTPLAHLGGGFRLTQVAQGGHGFTTSDLRGPRVEGFDSHTCTMQGLGFRVCGLGCGNWVARAKFKRERSGLLMSDASCVGLRVWGLSGLG